MRLSYFSATLTSLWRWTVTWKLWARQDLSSISRFGQCIFIIATEMKLIQNACTHVYTHACIHPTQARIHTHICIHIYSYTYLHMQAYTRHTHAHIHRDTVLTCHVIGFSFNILHFCIFISPWQNPSCSAIRIKWGFTFSLCTKTENSSSWKDRHGKNGSAPWVWLPLDPEQ